MPIYEYRCDGCGHRITLLVRGFDERASPQCRRCGRAEMRKLVSRVAVLRSEESRLESLADPGQLGDLDENDPKSVARWVRQMGREMGDDLGSDFDEVVDQIESGELPEEDGLDGEADTSVD